MKRIKILVPSLLSLSVLIACNNKNSSTEKGSPVNDTSLTNPASNAEDYHPDERQHIPTPDSSNVVGTDTIKDSSHK